VAVAALAHRVFQTMILQERSPVHAGEPGALVRMDQYLFEAFGATPP
jgi:hypothetical protein